MPQTDLLRIKIEVDGAGNAQASLAGVARAQEQVGGTASRASTGLQTMAGATQTLSRSVAALGGALSGLALVNFARSVINYGGALKDMSLQLGISTTALQEIGFSAAQAGVAMEGLSTALAQQSRHVRDAAEGQKASAEALNRLGISAVKLKQLAPDEQMLTLGRALLGVKNATEQNALAMDLWGKSGVRLLGIVRDNADSLDDFRRKAHEAGVVITDEDIQALDDMGDRLTVLQMKMKAFGAYVLNSLVGPIGTFIDQVQSAVSEFTAWFGRQGAAVSFTAEAKPFEDQLRALKAEESHLRNLALLREDERQRLTAIASEIAQVEGRLDAIARKARLARMGLPAEGLTIDITRGSRDLDVRGSNAIAGARHAEASATREAERANDAYFDSLERLRGTLDPGTHIMEEFAASVRQVDEAMLLGIQGFQNWDAVNLMMAAADRAGEALDRLEHKSTQAAAKTDDAWSETARRLDGIFADMWANMFDGAQNMLGNMASLLRRWLAEMSYALLARPLLVQVGLVGTSAGGVGGALGAAGNVGNLGLLGRLGSLIGGNSIGSMVGNVAQSLYFNTSLGGVPGLGTMLGNTAQNAAMYGNWTYGLAGVGGNMLGSWLGSRVFGPGSSTGSTIGGTVGAIGGSIVGVPLGGFIGSTIGSFLGSAFGREKEARIKPWSSATSRGFEDDIALQGPFGFVGLMASRSKHIDAEDTQKIAQAMLQFDEALGQLMSSGEIGRVRQAMAGWQGRRQDEEFSFAQYAQERGGAILGVLDPALKQIFDRLVAGGKAADTAATEILTMRNALDQLAGRGGESAVQTAVRQLEDLRTQALDLGFPSEQVAADIEAGYEALRDQVRAGVADLAGAGQGIRDQLAALWKQATALMVDAAAAGLDPAEVERALWERVRQMTQAVRDAMASFGGDTDIRAQLDAMWREAWRLMAEAAAVGIDPAEVERLLWRRVEGMQQDVRDQMDQLTGRSNSAAYAVEQLNRRFTELWYAAQALGMSTAEVEAAYREARNNLVQGYLEQERQAQGSLRGFVRGLADSLGVTGLQQFQASLQTSETLAPLQRLAGAQSLYQQTLSAARGGDLNAVNNFSGVAQQLLTVARDVYASGPQFQAVFSSVNRDLQQVLARQQDVQAELLRGIDASILQSSQDQIAELRDTRDQLIEELEDVRRSIRELAA